MIFIQLFRKKNNQKFIIIYKYFLNSIKNYFFNDYLNVFHKITAGNSHAFMLDQENNLYCWGANDKGQLGIFKLNFF